MRTWIRARKQTQTQQQTENSENHSTKNPGSLANQATHRASRAVHPASLGFFSRQAASALITSSLLLSTLFTSVVTTSTAQGAELAPAARLRKLSLQVRGILPTQKEYDQLSQVTSAQLERHFQDKATEYSNTEWAETKIMERVFEDLRLDVPQTVFFNPYYGNPGSNSALRAEAGMIDEIKRNQTRPVNPITIQYTNNLINSGRLALKTGNWDNLYLSDFLTEVGSIFGLLESASQNVRSQRVLSFFKEARALGHRLNSVRSLEDAIIDYQKNPEKFKDPAREFSKMKLSELYKELKSIIDASIQESRDQQYFSGSKADRERSKELYELAFNKVSEELTRAANLPESATDDVQRLAENTELRNAGNRIMGLFRSSYISRQNEITMEFTVAAPVRGSAKGKSQKQQTAVPTQETYVSIRLQNLNSARFSCLFRSLKDKGLSTYLGEDCVGANPSIGATLDAFPKLMAMIMARTNAVGQYGNRPQIEIPDFDANANNTQLIELLLSNRQKIFSAALASNTGAKRPNLTSFFNLPEFNARYQKTKFSKSAAFFRIFFCDEMRPVALVDQSTKSVNALKLFKFDGSGNAGIPFPSTTVAKESQACGLPEHMQPTCIGCHRKMDPIQCQVGLDGKINDPSKPFTMVYDDEEGKEHRVEVANAAALLPTIGKQPQYLSCQASKFWKWVIGEDVPLTQESKAKLAAKFEEVGRDPKRFIAYLTSLPEFYKDDALTLPPNFSSIKSTMARCNSCHSTVDTSMIPSFTKLPIGYFTSSDDRAAQLATHEDNMKYILKFTDLINNGKAPKMPPSDAGWKLTEPERAAIVRWVFHRGLDENNQPTLSREFVDNFFQQALPEVKKAAEAPAEIRSTFRPTWKRYLENSDLRKVLMQKLPVELSACSNQLYDDRASLGVKDKLTGLPVSDTVNQAFRSSFGRCISTSLKFVRATIEGGTSYAGLSEYYQMLGLEGYVTSEADKNKLSVPWSNLSEEERGGILSRIRHYYLNDQVLNNEDKSDFDELMKVGLGNFLIKNPAATVLEASLIAAYLAVNDDHFLSF